MNQQKTIHLTVNNIPYSLNIKPFDFNAQTRYEVSVNEAGAAIFAWDSEMRMFKSLSEDTSTLPDDLMQEINNRLLDMEKEKL